MTRYLSLSFSSLSEGVSSMSHLLDKPLLRAAVWSVSCVTCLGNSLVLWGRFTAKDENRVLSIIIRNLAGKLRKSGIFRIFEDTALFAFFGEERKLTEHRGEIQRSEIICKHRLRGIVKQKCENGIQMIFWLF